MKSKSMRCVRILSISMTGAGGLILVTGCGGSYATPGGGANINALAKHESSGDPSIDQTLARKPMAILPCGIACVRIQTPNYYSDSTETYGTGNYCVVTTRNVESNADLSRLQKLPMVSGIAPLSRLVLPQQLTSDLELRRAAATLHADMLLIYTLDTKYQLEDHLSPLSFVTLGLSPNITAQIVTTASAVLMDTRNGYVYGYAEATEHGAQLTNAWMMEQAVSDARKRTEAKAFSELVDNLQVTWGDVVKTINNAPSAQVPQK